MKASSRAPFVVLVPGEGTQSPFEHSSHGLLASNRSTGAICLWDGSKLPHQIGNDTPQHRDQITRFDPDLQAALPTIQIDLVIKRGQFV